MNQELYTKQTTPGGKVKYIPYQPEIYDHELSDAQILTLAGSLGITVLTQYQRLIPEHKRNARKIKAVETALLDMLHGSGQQIDDNMADYAMSCWNKAAMIMGIGARL